MKKKIIFIALLLLILIALGIQQDYIYPSTWDQIHIGMSRPEVYEILGKGRDQDENWEGHFWSDSGLVKNEISVFFKNDQVNNTNQQKLLFTGYNLKVVRIDDNYANH